MKRFMIFATLLIVAACDQSPLAPELRSGPRAPLSFTALTSGFKQISAGDQFFCAIDATDHVTCWGDNSLGQTNAPPDTFKQISSGAWYSCGIKSDDTLACWGFFRIDTPAGTYKEVSFATNHGCAIGMDDTLTCWGNNDYGQATPPSGTFKHVSGGQGYGCGIHADDTLECWGDNGIGQTMAPTGTFKQIGRGSFHTCALRTDDTIACWGANGFGESTPPSGTFKQVESGALALSCGINSSDSIVCWGWPGDDRTNSPAGAFTQVSTRQAYGCALDASGSISCWGLNNSNQFPPSGGTATATVASISPAAQQYSDNVTLSASVTADSGSPEGTVQFLIDGTAVGSPQTLSSGSATLTYTLQQTEGNHSLTADFTSSTADFANSTSSTASFSVRAEDAVVTPSATNSSVFKTDKGPANTATVSLSFTVREKTPDIASLGAAAGSGNFMYLMTVLHPAAGADIPMVCTNSVSGTGYATSNTLWCDARNVPAGTYEFRGAVIGGYYTGSYVTPVTVSNSGKLPPGKK